MNDISKNFTCNESIKEKEVRVIDSEGNQLGILQTKEALRMADESELDLVMISPNAKPPVCKIMDLGKYIYEQAKKEKEAKKKQKVTVIKEIRCGITIEENDIVIIVPYPIYKNHITSNYMDIIEEIFLEITGTSHNIIFCLDGEYN